MSARHELRRLEMEVGAGARVSALFLSPPDARACYVFAHGAGAGMSVPSMSVVAEDLADLGVATLRYQFPYMERGLRRPDPPALCHATVRAAVALASAVSPATPLFAGGRSFGGRMTSQAQAIEPLPRVKGLVFLAFPLHPANRPSVERAAHLRDVRIPMLFLQGTRDALADRALLESVIADLGAGATLALLDAADHSFHAPARSGRKDEDIRREALARMVEWIERVARTSPEKR